MTHRKRPTVVRFLVRFSLLSLGALLIWWLYVTGAPRRQGELQDFTIERGQSVSSIATNLHAASLIRSPFYFKLYVRLNNLEIQAGEYQLSPATPPSVLARHLTSGRTPELRLTIPEGYRREQIAELLSAKLGLDPSAFLAATQDLEGYLFPDTYSLAKDVDVPTVVALLRSNFDAKTRNLNLTRDDIILASIVEREALTPEEKPIVAGILLKRIKEGWALEVDATIQFIMGKPGDYWPTPLLGDRARRSPYNTYLNRGLPPGPIGNPGLISLEAVKNPVATPYYFYLHDRSGVIRYAATNAEHEANIAQYIR